METVVLKVDPGTVEAEPIRAAAETLRAGGLVAFPTETVYGLGANALDAAAVARIFLAKGRPATNPVIVHVADSTEVGTVVANWPPVAAALAARFWPGPLTLIVPKGERIPDIVTAGGTTVAVRCPNHPVARALIRAAGVPVAAPSANRSTELSPTRAEHVLKGLAGRIDLLLDGGPCSGGIESTVVDVTGDVPRLLRPGLISVPMLEAVCDRVETGVKAEGVARSPGQMAKHYSPRAEVRLVEPEQAEAEVAACELRGERALLCQLPPTPTLTAAALYAQLHELDARGADVILVTLPPDTPEWAAIRDRLTRAAAKQ